MLKYFETTISVPRVNDRGIEQDVSEQYIMLAQSCSEAETLTLACLGEGFVTAVKLSEYAEIVKGENPEHYYDVRVAFIIPDDRGKERKEVTDYLVHSDSVKHADAIIRDRLAAAMVQWNICRVVETRIVGYITISA